MPSIKAIGKWGGPTDHQKRVHQETQECQRAQEKGHDGFEDSQKEKQRQTDGPPGQPQHGGKKITTQRSPSVDQGVATLAV
jgi:hypothetical protein